MNSQFNRSEWFRKDRFGMFIHWGLYAIPARGEWVRSMERIPSDEYDKYFQAFDPADYNPKEWARQAKAAGMKYVVLTAKHHDGFCLFDTKFTDFNSVNICGRDLVKEFVEAVRGEGLKVGLYFSLIDWRHPDFPKYADNHHPMRGREEFKDEKIDFDNYLNFMHGQVKEIVTNYGKLDILWFDFSYGNMRNETWKAKELVEMVRTYQPEVVMDNRLETSGESFGTIVTDDPNPWSGDFVSPEMIIPPEGIRNLHGEPVPWELCATMNNNWGYVAFDQDYKPASLIVRKLVECVSKGGNMILNVGPDARGNFPNQAVSILNGIGTWMEKNSGSIYGCGNADIPKPEWGRYTKNGNTIYAHVLEASMGPLALTGISAESVESITLLRDGSEVRSGESFVTVAYEGILFVSLGERPQYTYPLPDEIDTVIKIVLKV